MRDLSKGSGLANVEGADFFLGLSAPTSMGGGIAFKESAWAPPQECTDIQRGARVLGC